MTKPLSVTGHSPKFVIHPNLFLTLNCFSLTRVVVLLWLNSLPSRALPQPASSDRCWCDCCWFGYGTVIPCVSACQPNWLKLCQSTAKMTWLIITMVIDSALITSILFRSVCQMSNRSLNLDSNLNCATCTTHKKKNHLWRHKTHWVEFGCCLAQFLLTIFQLFCHTGHWAEGWCQKLLKLKLNSGTGCMFTGHRWHTILFLVTRQGNH